MKVVILAAGKGKRMGLLGENNPKSLLKVCGKTLLSHKLDILPANIDEVVIVVGYLKDKIIDAFGDKYNGRKISYVTDEDAVKEKFLGTAHSLFLCKDILSNEQRFLVMMGDDIYCREDIEECGKLDWAIVNKELVSIKGKAKTVVDEEGKIIDIIERYPHDEAGLVCTGMYSMTPKIFDSIPVAIGGGEFGLPQTILTAKNDVRIQNVHSKFWLQVNSPQELEEAEAVMCQNEIGSTTEPVSVSLTI